MRHPLTLEAFAEWLDKQPADQTYAYVRSEECAIYQYLGAQGFPVLSVGPFSWTDQGCHTHPLLQGMNEACQGRGLETDWTFGAAALRAKALLETVSCTTNE